MTTDAATPAIPESPHFIAIGGVGMSAIAMTLLERGATVSGSDTKESDTTQRLREMGATVHIGHAAENIANAGGVVVSSAIGDDNVELLEARRRALPVLHRSELLGALMATGRSVGVAGAHGKTTTTLMAGATLIGAGLDPTVLVGGWVPEFNGGARVGGGDLIVAEVDESDGSFLNIRPDISIITNIDFDHPDFYADRQAVHDAFIKYVNQSPEEAVVVIDADDAGAQTVIDRFERRVVRCALDTPSADAVGQIEQLNAMSSRFTVRLAGVECGAIDMRVGGEHNVRNALLSFVAALLAGGDVDDCARGLGEYRGVRRRFEFRGKTQGARVFDDYAHHPREVAATLDVAARLREEEGGRVIAIFQPHRYSRTLALARDFGASFGQADRVIIMDVYGAGEGVIEGVDGRLIADATRDAGHSSVVYCPSLDEAADAVADDLREGDIVMTLGAGDVTELGPMILRATGDNG